MPLSQLSRRQPKVLANSLHAGITACGGQILIEALCRKYGVWESIMQVPFPNSLDQRSNLQCVAQLLFTFASGGTTVFEAAALKQDPLLLSAVGLDSPMGEDVLGGWLHNQTSESITGLREVNLQMIRRATSEMGSEVLDVNYGESPIGRFAPTVEAHQLPSIWQTMSTGPFVMDRGWRREEDDGSGWKEEALRTFLEAQQEFTTSLRLRFRPSDFHEIENLCRILSEVGLQSWAMQVGYSEVAGAVDNPPPRAWKTAPPGDLFADEYGTFYPRANAAGGIGGRIIGARKTADHGPATYRYLIVPRESDVEPHAAFKLWYGAPNRNLPADDLSHSLRLEQMLFSNPKANEAWFAIACLAYNLVSALRVTTLPVSYGELPIASVIHRILQFPATLTNPGNRPQLRLFVPDDLAPCFRTLIDAGIGSPKRGRRSALYPNGSGRRSSKNTPSNKPE